MVVPDLRTEIRPEPERIWRQLVFRSYNNTADKSNGVSNAVSCCKETVQCFLCCQWLPVFDEICGKAMLAKH